MLYLPLQLLILRHLPFQEALGQHSFLLDALGRKQVEVAGAVLAVAEVVGLDPAAFNQCAQAVVHLADADAEGLGEFALRQVGLLLDQAHQGVVGVGLLHRHSYIVSGTLPPCRVAGIPVSALRSITERRPCGCPVLRLQRVSLCGADIVDVTLQPGFPAEYRDQQQGAVAGCGHFIHGVQAGKGAFQDGDGVAGLERCAGRLFGLLCVFVFAEEGDQGVVHLRGVLAEAHQAAGTKGRADRRRIILAGGEPDKQVAGKQRLADGDPLLAAPAWHGQARQVGGVALLLQVGECGVFLTRFGLDDKPACIHASRGHGRLLGTAKKV